MAKKPKNSNGMGSIRKKGKGVEWRQMVDGVERSLYAKDMKSLQDKIKTVADLPIVKEKFTVSEWFDRWLSVYIKPLKKAATYNQYNDIYRKHIRPAIGSRKMTSIKPFDIQAVIAKMHENGMATKTMRHGKTVMSCAFRKAFDDKIIPANPVQKIDIPQKQAKPRKVLTTDELDKIFKAMANSRWIWAVRFMLVTGVRRGELLALRWSDIDTDQKRITIDESNSSTGLGDTKSAKVHTVPLSGKALEYLNAQKEMLKAEFNPSLFHPTQKAMALVFPTEKGNMIKPNTFYHYISRYGEAVGVHASPHCLRHTFVYLMRNKLSLKQLQDILGHDESTTTLDIYGTMLEDQTDLVAAEIDEVFDKVETEIVRLKDRKRKRESDGKVIRLFG